LLKPTSLDIVAVGIDQERGVVSLGCIGGQIRVCLCLRPPVFTLTFGVKTIDGKRDPSP